jgi:hypothetical protein
MTELGVLLLMELLLLYINLLKFLTNPPPLRSIITKLVEKEHGQKKSHLL